MKILLYRYGSICEPDLIENFKKIGLEVIEETTEINNKKISNSERIKQIESILQNNTLLFVFSINFFPSIAEICHIYKISYLCWTVDSPVAELFSKSIVYDTNHIFLFDYAQYQQFSPYNPKGIHYLPLAAEVNRFNNCINTINNDDIQKFSTDISFIGSLYNERNPFNKLKPLSNYSAGYIDALVETSLKIYGSNIIEECLNDKIVEDIKQSAENFYQPYNPIADSDFYIVAHNYIGIKITETERIRTLNALADCFKVDLFTRSDCSSLKNVQIHGGVQTLTEMPKIFHLSKINLNMTSKPIQTGLPLRIFDIMGCGGFLMTNYQAELPEYFEIGKDLETYSSIEELIEKCDYYLKHDEERKKIAENGYRKICESHTYSYRITEIIKQVLQA